MKLKPGFEALALQLQEAATELSHSDIHKALSDQLNDMHPNDYCYVMDTYGDDSDGDVVYQHKGQTYKAPYSLGTMNGKRTAEIDEDNRTNVVPRTVYDEEADDSDQMTSMESERVAEKLYTKLPAYERFISKDERAGADAADFAGKGKSFPILKPGDVKAAVSSMGRAGADNVGTSTLKKNIIAIAKRKGWTKYLPKAWQGTTNTDEADRREDVGSVRLFESAMTLETIRVKEAKADYEIRLISPGKGSSAFYPKEVLQRDGPKVFKAGTHVYLNHPTAAEEASRPEGDVKNLAGVLSTAAEWKESHAQGPGLYARMKVFADHGQMVEEKAPHVGMSIRASGIAEAGRKHDGLPILKELTSAESVDIVTKPGARGAIFTEGARRTQPIEREAEIEMTATDVQKLIEAGVQAALLPTRARETATRLLEGVTLPPQAKTRIIERVCQGINPADFDETKFSEAVAKEAAAEGRYLAEVTGSGRVLGMGSQPTVSIDPKERKKLKEAAKEQRRADVDVFAELMGDRDAAKRAVAGRVA
jgi:hypothetical protein